MEQDRISQMLTPAAREALDEMVTDYRTRVLLRAHAHAARLTGEVREVAVRDLMAAGSEINLGAAARTTRIGQLSRFYTYAGLFAAILGLGIYAVGFVAGHFEITSQILGMTFFVGGMVMAATGGLVARQIVVRRVRHEMAIAQGLPDQFEALGRFLSRWQEVEVVLRSIVAERLGESAAGEPLSALLRTLRHHEWIDAAMADELRGLLHLRNGLLHSPEPTPTVEVVRGAQRAGSALERLEEMRHDVRIGGA